jgi:hypothetical protein
VSELPGIFKIQAMEYNERTVLYLIHNYPELLEGDKLFTLLRSSESATHHPRFSIFVKVWDSLRAKGYVTQNKNNKWIVTGHGQFYRFHTNKVVQFILILIGLILAAGVIKFNCGGNIKTNDSRSGSYDTLSAKSKLLQAMPDSTLHHQTGDSNQLNVALISSLSDSAKKLDTNQKKMPKIIKSSKRQ